MVRTTEEKLFGTTDIYRIIVDAAEEGIWIADIDDKVTFVNKKLVDMLGYSRDEIIGKKIFDFTDEKNRAIMKESIEQSRRGKRDTYVFSLRSKTGRFILQLVSTTPMQDEKGRYIGTVQLCTDMTGQKKVEDELREAKAKADMYLDLLSHDIRNMNQIASGYLEMAMGKLDAGESLTKANRVLVEKPLNAYPELIGTYQYRKEPAKCKKGHAAHGKDRPRRGRGRRREQFLQRAGQGNKNPFYTGQRSLGRSQLFVERGLY